MGGGGFLTNYNSSKVPSPTSARFKRAPDVRIHRPATSMTTSMGRRVALDGDGFCVIRAIGISALGRVEATIESEGFDTLEGAVGWLQRGGGERAKALSATASKGKNALGKMNKGRGRPAMSGIDVLRRQREVMYELPIETQVWHVAGASQRVGADSRLMVVRLSALKGNASEPGFQDSEEGDMMIGETRNVGAGSSKALPMQIADGLPFVDAKTFGARVDPFMIRPNISKAAFRALLVRAIGENLADDREPYPVLDKSNVQLQVANGVQYHVLAIRAPGHAPGDFSMAVDDQGRAYVRADEAFPAPIDPKQGRAFELLCQFPSLVQLKTCRCIYQEGVLYIIVFPRLASARPLRLTATDSTGKSTSDGAELAGIENASGKHRREEWESDDDEPFAKTAALAAED